jgi:soluble lytic murein transglycosylase-like protein
MMRKSTVILCLLMLSPASADTPTVKVTSRRGVSSKEQIVTCSTYRRQRTEDPVTAAYNNSSIAALVRRIAREEGIDEYQFLALVYQESRFNPCAKSRSGAKGLAQLMPGTAADLGVDPNDIEQNLRGGALYHKRQLDRFLQPPTTA